MVAPVNTVLPVITGTAEVGQVLSLSDGTWTGSTSLAYSWLAGGNVIAGETSNTYTVKRAQIALSIVGRVTATNGNGSTVADSLATATIPSTLIIEDGSVVASADSYASVAYADDYHDKYGNSDWAELSGAAKDSQMRQATAYLLQKFAAQWKGYRKDANQTLDWPRVYVYREPFYVGGIGAFPFLVSDTIVPTEVKDQCCELALKVYGGPLMADLSQAILVDTVGPLSTTFDKNSSQQIRYESVIAALRPYLDDYNSISSEVSLG